MTNKKILIKQFVRFISVGVLNTVIDLSVLNFLIYISNIFFDREFFSVSKIVSFLVAVTVSYFLNKYFVFSHNRKGDDKKTIFKEKVKFFIVSFVGLVVNVVVASFSFFVLTNFYNFEINIHFMATISALVGSIVTLCWNFLGYKFLVFKKNK